MGDPNTFVISRVAYGSTLIELIALQVVSVGAVLTALNFALRQANTAIVQAQEIRKNARKLLKAAPKVSRKRRKNVSRVQALQQTVSPTNDATLLRHAVGVHGYRQCFWTMRPKSPSTTFQVNEILSIEGSAWHALEIAADQNTVHPFEEYCQALGH